MTNLFVSKVTVLRREFCSCKDCFYAPKRCCSFTYIYHRVISSIGIATVSFCLLFFNLFSLLLLFISLDIRSHTAQITYYSKIRCALARFTRSCAYYKRASLTQQILYMCCISSAASLMNKKLSRQCGSFALTSV